MSSYYFYDLFTKTIFGFFSHKNIPTKLLIQKETEKLLKSKKNIKNMKLLGTSLLQKGEKIKVNEKAVEMLQWLEGDDLVQFYDEKERALAVKKLGEVVEKGRKGNE